MPAVVLTRIGRTRRPEGGLDGEQQESTAYSSHMSDPRDVLTRPAAGGVTFAYGEHPDQVIERFDPAEVGGAPIVFVHGGFWRHEYDRSHVRPLCNDLAGRGHRVYAVEYRRTGGDGGWPTTFDDIDDALRHIGREVEEPVVLSGHSAGGQLALRAAIGEPVRDREPAVAIQRVVALAPVSDLARAFADGLDEDAVAVLMGGGPEKFTERYAVVDPMVAGPVSAPVVLVHGDRDTQVPVDYSRAFASAHDCELVELPGVEHFGLIDPRSTAWPWVYDAMRRGSG